MSEFVIIVIFSAMIDQYMYLKKNSSKNTKIYYCYCILHSSNKLYLVLLILHIILTTDLIYFYVNSIFHVLFNYGQVLMSQPLL